MATTELKPGARVLVAAEVAQCAGVRDGCTVVRLCGNQDFYPVWYRQWGHGGTASTAISQNVLEITMPTDSLIAGPVYRIPGIRWIKLKLKDPSETERWGGMVGDVCCYIVCHCKLSGFWWSDLRDFANLGKGIDCDSIAHGKAMCEAHNQERVAKWLEPVTF